MAADDDPSALERRQRTVTKPYRGREDVEMDFVGWAIFAGLLVVMLPLLPFVAVLWVVARLLGRGGRE